MCGFGAKMIILTIWDAPLAFAMCLEASAGNLFYFYLGYTTPNFSRRFSEKCIYLAQEERSMNFTVEFFRIRPGDAAHAILDRVPQDVPTLEDAKVRAQSLFETLDMPQAPDGLRILDGSGAEVFSWKPVTAVDR